MPMEEGTGAAMAGVPMTPPRGQHARGDDDKGEKIVHECVDVYLLAPEEEREIELKDFTIMKPKNNKMHRLVRYYPRCEISYRAVPPPPPEEKVVTSPNGTNTTTITTTHRHNGGFSNPSRNAEVFRLKRRLLKEYYASVKKDPSYLSMDDDALEARGLNGGRPTLPSTYRRPSSPQTWSMDGGAAAPPPPLSMFPKYRRIAVGDEDTAPLTSDLKPKMSWKARINYISSLWPDIAPVDDDDDIMDYYGLEVQIISEEERKKELESTKGDTADGTANKEQEERQKEAEAAKSPEKKATEALTEDDDDDVPEMTVETRSTTKMKDTELKISPLASKQDDWVQCDKCQKWRRLPNHVNVSELPATWYCKMNRWDKRFNKCSIPEEKVVMPMKGADLIDYRERKFAGDFLQRLKRMEKSALQYKYSDVRDDSGDREVVQCVECFKIRPLIGGMDPRKIAQPFVCWMNTWDELHASCSAPQGAIASRHYESYYDSDGPSSSVFNIQDSTPTRKSNSAMSGQASTNGKQSTSASSSANKKAPGKAASTGVAGKAQMKRKPSDSAVAGQKGGISGNNAASAGGKRVKRSFSRSVTGGGWYREYEALSSSDVL
ncbi:hypothetical protein Poli38472_006818 [Pythium oligandrum]|uniref:CW-type domain-containing protein n=1 Tax=Pythium oligandrum TaxID=41045 RepID=A0A8K1C5I7_PYTOL|nr:hypothetical protein Poli38472_006818 [Pythium oligandrum]|eukprot:TMW56808.1 hypothetical protein Poli38472_006818 [Pythium oligandrum]